MNVKGALPMHVTSLSSHCMLFCLTHPVQGNNTNKQICLFVCGISFFVCFGGFVCFFFLSPVFFFYLVLEWEWVSPSCSFTTGVNMELMWFPLPNDGCSPSLCLHWFLGCWGYTYSGSWRLSWQESYLARLPVLAFHPAAPVVVWLWGGAGVWT